MAEAVRCCVDPQLVREEPASSRKERARAALAVCGKYRDTRTGAEVEGRDIVIVALVEDRASAHFVHVFPFFGLIGGGPAVQGRAPSRSQRPEQSSQSA